MVFEVNRQESVPEIIARLAQMEVELEQADYGASENLIDQTIKLMQHTRHYSLSQMERWALQLDDGSFFDTAYIEEVKNTPRRFSYAMVQTDFSHHVVVPMGFQLPACPTSIELKWALDSALEYLSTHQDNAQMVSSCQRIAYNIDVYHESYLLKVKQLKPLLLSLDQEKLQKLRSFLSHKCAQQYENAVNRYIDTELCDTKPLLEKRAAFERLITKILTFSDLDFLMGLQPQMTLSTDVKQEHRNNNNENHAQGSSSRITDQSSTNDPSMHTQLNPLFAPVSSGAGEHNNREILPPLHQELQDRPGSVATYLFSPAITGAGVRRSTRLEARQNTVAAQQQKPPLNSSKKQKLTD